MRIAVVGAGVVGMSTAAALLDRGHDVVCYESGAIMGQRSVGSTRIFRLAHVDPDLVTLARRARTEFDRWAAAAGRPMVVGLECVITGVDLADRALAMAKAGADYELVEAGSGTRRLRLPVVEDPGVALVDVGGGVVDVDAVRAFLTARAGGAVVRDRVYALDITAGGAASVTSERGRAEYDALVLAAGADTAHLAAQVGIYVPTTLVHHLRLTFGVDGDDLSSWIDNPPDGLGTYQHQAGPGRWAVGGHVDPGLTAWEVGRDAAVEASRAALVGYARTRLTVDPTVVDSVYCTTVPNLGDGVELRRNGPVLAVHGNNLMKLAPVVGAAAADAVVAGTAPTVSELVAA